MRETVHVPLGDRAYDVLIGPGLLAEAGALILPLLPRPRVAIVTETRVAALHLDGCAPVWHMRASRRSCLNCPPVSQRKAGLTWAR